MEKPVSPVFRETIKERFFETRGGGGDNNDPEYKKYHFTSRWLVKTRRLCTYIAILHLSNRDKSHD